MKKIFIVTGANGFLGNNIVRKLLEKDEEVRALVHSKKNTKALKGLNCEIYEGDVTDFDSLKDIFTIDKDIKLYVIHCAAVVSIKSKYDPYIYKVNVEGTMNVAKKVLESNGKLIYINSVHSIPDKDDVITEITNFDPNKIVGQYAKTKAVAAKNILEMVSKEGLDACILQPSGIIGPNDFGNSHLTQMILDFINGKLKACVKGGYDFVDVRDVADAAINACSMGKKGECYLLSNKNYEIKDILDMISEIAGIDKIKHVLPMWLAKFTAPLSEFYYKLKKQPPLYTSYSLYTLTVNTEFSNNKAKKELKYKNRDMKETLKDTIDNLKKQKRI